MLTADTDTLWAVVIGAVLATVGGFAATQLEHFMRRRESERGAALLFGEVLSVIELLTELAEASRRQGDPYGPFTMRLLRAVRRETEAYDRNRESLYDLRDAKLRAQIHALMVRITLTLDGVFDGTDEIASTQKNLAGLGADDPTRAELAGLIESLLETRHGAFDFLVETVSEIKPLIAILRPLAKETFDAYATVVERPRRLVNPPA
jgi:hypothetical protein